MVHTPSSTPPINPNAPQGPQKPEKESSGAEKGFHAKPLTFLGMYFNSEDAGKLWQTIIQAIGREIEKEKAKAVKRIRSFGKEEDQD